MNAIQVICNCGATFSATEQLAGQQVNCPACGQIAVVPAINNFVAISCPCGNQIQANSMMIGRQVNCPSCGQLVLVGQSPGHNATSVDTADGPKSSQKKSKTAREHDAHVVAILAYLALVGFIIAFVIYQKQKRHSLASFHLRQAGGLYLTGIVIGIALWPLAFLDAIPGFIDIWFALSGMISFVVGLGWCYGLICAILKRQDPVPIIGDFFQDLLASIE